MLLSPVLFLFNTKENYMAPLHSVIYHTTALSEQVNSSAHE